MNTAHPPRRGRAAGLLLACLLASAVSSAPPAQASAGSTGSGYQTRRLPGCTAYGSSSGFGIACSGRGGVGTSLRDLLAGQPVPTCWESEPPPEFRRPDRQQPGSWWLRTCLDGIDPQTLAIAAGGLELTYGYVYLAPGGEHPLSAAQQAFVDALVERGQVPLPFPVVQMSPSPSPRVGEVVAFSLGERATPALTVHGVTMVARLVGLAVEPEGAGGPRITCTGGGRVLRPDEVDTVSLTDQADDVCAYRYGRSSFQAGGDADQPDRYPARVTASWRVLFDDGGTLGPFDKQAVNEVRVAEVQTLVASGS